MTGPGGVARTIDQGERKAGLYKFAFAGGTRSSRTRAAEPEGRYRWSITAVDAEGRRSTAERSFSLNNTLGFISVQPSRMTVGRKRGGRLLIGFTLTRPARVNVAITSKTGQLLRVVRNFSARAGKTAVLWNGKYPNGKPVFSGAYVAGVVATNRVGRASLPAPSGSGADNVPTLRGRAGGLHPQRDHRRAHRADRRPRDLCRVHLDVRGRRAAAASELVMVYAGAVAAGAFAGQSVVLFGEPIESEPWAYVAMASAGALGYILGSIAGWAIGYYGGRPFVERRGRWLHVTPHTLHRAEAVRPLRRLGGRGRPRDPVCARSSRYGRRLPHAARSLHAADDPRLGRLGVRVRGRRLGGRLPVGGLPPQLPVRGIRRRRGDPPAHRSRNLASSARGQPLAR